jgi:polyphosphate kinase
MNEITNKIDTKSPAKSEAKIEATSDMGSVKKTWNLASPELYLNRELTWLEFNRRVLHEAEDERTPLLERVKFLAIVSSNLDEFFMKRIGGLKQQMGAGLARLSVDGRTPQEQVMACHEVVRDLETRKEKIFQNLISILSKKDIQLLSYDALTKAQVAELREHFIHNIFPLLTPQSIDPAHPFPFLSNLSLNLLVTVQLPNKPDKTSLTRIKAPVGAGVPRFIKVGGKHHYVLLEDVIAHNLDLLLPGVEVVEVEVFRVTRNANTESNEEHAEDLLVMIESELRERRFAPFVRMEALTGINEVHRGYLAAELGLNEECDVFEVGRMPAMRDLFEIAFLPLPEFHDEPHEPLDHAEIRGKRCIFHSIRDHGPFLLQHPYESFANTVERFLREAALDPKVRAIKMTLYRTSGESKVVDYLVQAAQNGKQVAVVVELKARFDEAANIRWATRMEEAGVHVTYGVVGLKTHSKITLVVRQDFNGIQRYLHIGTGNYHAGTARLYCDLGLLTNDEQLGQDASELFNFLTTGYTPERNYKKLLPSPRHLKKALLAMIERERKLHSAKKPGLIQFKMNALEDVDITRALYEASRDGVRVDLIVRDTCRFRPGLPGLSESARVLGVVGRFLEHTRIYYFQNGGNEEYYIGSADCMQRNLESRVEVVTPIEAPQLRALLREQLDLQLNDRRQVWEMQPDGSFVQRIPGSQEEQVGCQERLIQLAQKRLKKASKDQRKLGKERLGR